MLSESSIVGYWSIIGKFTLIVNQITGTISFEDVRPHNNHVYATYQKAAEAKIKYPVADVRVKPVLTFTELKVPKFIRYQGTD